MVVRASIFLPTNSVNCLEARASECRALHGVEAKLDETA